MSSTDHMRAAFAALLRDDLNERDRQCDLARKALKNEQYDGIKRLMEIDFFVTSNGTVIPITAMMAKA